MIRRGQNRGEREREREREEERIRGKNRGGGKEKRREGRWELQKYVSHLSYSYFRYLGNCSSKKFRIADCFGSVLD
jgi:hypothetical protein